MEINTGRVDNERERESARAPLRTRRRADQVSLLFLAVFPCRGELGRRQKDDLVTLATTGDLPASIHAAERLDDLFDLLNLLDLESRGGLRDDHDCRKDHDGEDGSGKLHCGRWCVLTLGEKGAWIWVKEDL